MKTKSLLIALEYPLCGPGRGWIEYPQIPGGRKNHELRQQYFELVSRYIMRHKIPLRTYFEFSQYKDRARIHFRHVDRKDDNDHEYLYLTDDVLKKDYVKETLKIWNKYRGVSNEKV